jgi:hypothetical protein
MEGNYQNTIEELTDLEVYRYENIFKIYQTGSKNYFFYNIIKKVLIPKDINNDYFFTYTIQNNIPFTTLSFQAYNTTQLWWLICIVNDIKYPQDPSIIGKTIKILKKEYIKPVLNSITAQLQ